jgi:hypothetical protein
MRTMRHVAVIGVLIAGLLAPGPAVAQSGTPQPHAAIAPALLAFEGGAAPVLFQVVDGRYRAVFTASPDHDAIEHGTPVVQRYELVVTRPGGQAVPAIDLGKPALTAGEVIADVHTALISLPAGEGYSAVVRAVGPAGVTASAAAPFALTVRAPAATGPPAVGRQP